MIICPCNKWLSQQDTPFIFLAQVSIHLLLGQLGGRAKHFKSPENPKFIIQEITELYTYL